MSLLRTERLTKQFGKLTAVDTVDIGIEANEIHSVIGPNGAGKSTLFNLITGLLTPSAGSVYFKDEDITGLAPRRIVRRGISRSFQIADLFEGLTVRENVRIAAQSLDEDKDAFWKHAASLEGPSATTDAILADIGLAEQADVRANELSHGDRRKLDIGLAITVEPELFLLDEPTAGMGKEESTETIRMIQHVSEDRGITPVLIEHDLEIVMGVSDRITVLNEGAVLASGPPEEIRRNEEVQQAYLGTRGE